MQIGENDADAVCLQIPTGEPSAACFLKLLVGACKLGFGRYLLRASISGIMPGSSSASASSFASSPRGGFVPINARQRSCTMPSPSPLHPSNPASMALLVPGTSEDSDALHASSAQHK